MRLITRDEYDEAVSTAAQRVFSTDAPSADVREASQEILDMADGGDDDRAQDCLQQRAFDVVWFNHPFGDDNFDVVATPTMAGAIVQHSGCETIADHYRDQWARLSTKRPAHSVIELAAGAFYTDVHDAVTEHVRWAVGSNMDDNHDVRDADPAAIESAYSWVDTSSIPHDVTVETDGGPGGE